MYHIFSTPSNLPVVRRSVEPRFDHFHILLFRLLTWGLRQPHTPGLHFLKSVNGGVFLFKRFPLKRIILTLNRDSLIGHTLDLGWKSPRFRVYGILAMRGLCQKPLRF